MSGPRPRALVALTRPGARRLSRLWAAWPDADFFVAAAWAGEVAPGPGPGRLVAWSGPARRLIPDLAAGYRAVVMGLSVGAVVRLWAPHLVDKRRDPAVVAVDDGGHWAVSVLGGHAAGANALAAEVAAVLGARPVVTTGTDSLGLADPETWARAAGLRAEDPAAFKAVAAAWINGEPVGMVADGEDVGQEVEGLPGPVEVYPSLAAARAAARPPAAWVVVSHRRDAAVDGAPVLLLRPRCLVVGVGTVRGASPDAVEGLVRTALAEAGLAWRAVGVLASASLKADETALAVLASRHGWTVRLFDPVVLRTVTVPTPSAEVDRLVGTPSVSEAAAILAAGGGPLLVPKRRCAEATVAVAHGAVRVSSCEG
ncbi:MAG: cobalamin biosynthesis protein [Actinomycetia bacterium]|nr:cobalamin biosynthesis protein [Actinomycetes bacterium]